MNTCDYCGGPLPENSFRHRQYCTASHRQMAFAQRRQAERRALRDRALTDADMTGSEILREMLRLL